IFIFILFFMKFLDANIINIPADQPTIQQGIDVSVDSDTVLVQPGTYVENIDYNGKDITVASLFLTTQDSSYISQTIIDGNQDGSVVIFEYVEDSTAVLCGFTITNGYPQSGYTPDGSGGGIFIKNSNPTLHNIIIIGNSARYSGGGIYCKESCPYLRNIIISGNSAGSKGGGIYCYDYSTINLENVTISRNIAISWAGGGIFCYDNSSVIFSHENRCNIFLNSAPSGTDLNAYYNCPIINVIVDTFTVLEPTDYFAYSMENFTYDILNAKFEPVNEDLYVSPTGSNSNTGLTADEPLLSINYALLKIESLNEETHIIHIANGTYSPSQTGEFYPIICKNYIFLHGENQEFTILDGEGSNRILHCPYESDSIVVENLTIRNGNARRGGGIFCDFYSSPSFNNITLSDNHASYLGGGIYCEEYSHSSVTNVTIRGNSAGTGGGIADDCGYPSSLSLSNVTIKENSAIIGGGIYWFGEGLHFNSANRCNIYLNTSTNNVGNDLYTQYAYSGISVIVDTFTVLNPTDFHAFPIDDFSFYILHGIQNQVNSDLYVSPEGDNGNNGLSEEEPLKTIQYACSIILSDSLNPHTIYLSEGTYSPSINGEFFPISLPDNVSLTGENEDNVILDAEEFASVMRCDHGVNVTISNLTITNGSASYGGGIYCYLSSPSLVNITITCNSAIGSSYNYGGGIYCGGSSPSLENVKIENNFAVDQGGGIFCGGSNPSLVNVTISNNSTDDRGGGIFCYNSDPSLENVTIANNSAVDNGGGIYCDYEFSNPSLVNCILWDNSLNEISGPITIFFSDIQGGWEGEGNIDTDPLFTDPQNGDFHLTWANFPIPDFTMSPCIDAGNPNSPFDPDSTIADMGAFYFDQNQTGIENTPFIPNSITKLIGNYPNPFNPSTTIRFTTENTEKNTEILIYNMKGQQVKKFSIDDGRFSIEWDGTDENNKPVTSGVYFYNLRINGKIIDTKKCLLLR
ncbi:MAG TPA: DUF1565 domain-containing protein, partial [Firmicutes bacterium]|nr:DUF1565 domain-containing protein [Bacillota bacterium]